MAKVFERIIYDQLYHYLTKNNFLSCHQSGFRSLHSTLTAIDWDIDCGLVNAVIFLDLKKAFDTVDHDILFRKLQYYGICCTSHQWFASYLDNRTQICYLNSNKSTPKGLRCGVPHAGNSFGTSSVFDLY